MPTGGVQIDVLFPCFRLVAQELAGTVIGVGLFGPRTVVMFATLSSAAFQLGLWVQTSSA